MEKQLEYYVTDNGHTEYVIVNGTRYNCLPASKQALGHTTNMKEYVEAMEYLAYRVLISHQMDNKGLFERCS